MSTISIASDRKDDFNLEILRIVSLNQHCMKIHKTNILQSTGESRVLANCTHINKQLNFIGYFYQSHDFQVNPTSIFFATITTGLKCSI